MKLLTHRDMIELDIKASQCYLWVDKLLKEKDKVVLPPKLSIKPYKEVFYNIMPSIIPEINASGVKVVTRYPGRIPSLDSQIMLYDFDSGEIKAIMDGNYITTMRTGAVAAHSIKILAKKNFYSMGFIGLGNQARATIKVLLSIFPNRKFLFKLKKYKDQHEIFKKYVQSLDLSKNISFEFCDSYETTIKSSDVVVSSATYFENDLCTDECFDEGCLIVPIHTRGFMNCDLFFDKVFADDINHVKGFKYFDNFKNFAEISDILSKKSVGRANDKERIIVYNIGLSIHDVYFASNLLNIANKKNLGETFDFFPPKEKFWLI